MSRKLNKSEEPIRVIIDPRDASKDQHIPDWALQKFIVQGLVVRDHTNKQWCSKDGKPLPFK